jgi:hypothetical protein
MNENSPKKLLKDLIDAEKNNYAEAIKKNQQLEQVKNLFLKIKKLEKEAAELSGGLPAVNEIKYSVNEEINFQQLKQNFINKTQEYIAALENLTLEDLFDPNIYSKVASLRYQSVLQAANLREITMQIVIKNNSSSKAKDIKTPSENFYL